jgi:hypothetical protein
MMMTVVMASIMTTSIFLPLPHPLLKQRQQQHRSINGLSDNNNR